MTARHATEGDTIMTTDVTAQDLRRAGLAELPPLDLDFRAIVEHDADRITSIRLVDGTVLFLTTGDRRLVEVGNDWCLIRTGYGEADRLELVRYAAIATVTLG